MPAPSPFLGVAAQNLTAFVGRVRALLTQSLSVAGGRGSLYYLTPV
jgi:hypothetical protein